MAISKKKEQGDKSFKQPFFLASTVTVNHNLGKEPAVTVVDSGGTEAMVKVEHASLNTCVVSWNGTFSGNVLCN